MTDSSLGFRIWSGDITNYSQMVYQNELAYGDNWGRVIFGTRDKEARFVNEHEFSLIGQYASLSSYTGQGNDGSWERRTQQQFINKGVFRRSGSGASTIEIPLLNQGRLELKEGFIYVTGGPNIFTNEGVVEIQNGRFDIYNTHSHTGVFIAKTGELRFNGGTHTFTNDLDLQGDQFYFDGGEFTGIIQDQLNWIGGTAVDLTIAAGSKLVMTDSSLGFRIWSGDITNYSQMVYQNELAYGDNWGRVIFGTRDKAARFVNEHEFSLIGQYASLSSYTGQGNDGSWERRTQQQFINKGVFRRSGSGASTIEIPLLNQGRLELKEGFIYVTGGPNIFTNEGVVEIQNGRIDIYNTHSHTGVFIAKTGELRFNGGTHTFTNDLDLQGDQFYFDGGEFTGIIQDQLNWIGGTAVDLTIAAGANLVLTDSSPDTRMWAGEIVNHSKLEYRNEEITGYYTGPIIFGTNSKAARFINEHEFALIGNYASLTSSTGANDGSWERRGQQQFINKGLFSRSGSGTSTIDIPFLNQGTFVAETGGTYITGQDYVQMLGKTLVKSDASISIDSNRSYQLLGGSFGGDGSLYGKLFNQSVVNPGETIGSLLINGDYEQSHDGRIVIEIAGHEATARDSLIIRDHATLDGIIEVDFMNGFMPSIGDAFEIIRYGSIEGRLSLKSPLQNRGIGQKLSYRSDRLLFSVVNAEILGIPEAGRILSAPASFISGNPIISPDYLWQSSADGIAWTQVGSNSSSYLVAPADQGKQLRLVVSYTDGQGYLESVTMAAGIVGTINGGAATFSITGTPAVGNTLTATNSSPDPDGNGEFTYSWQTSSDGFTWSTVGIDNATYLIAPADEGRYLRVVVSYIDGENFLESVTIDASSAVAPGLPSDEDGNGLVDGSITYQIYTPTAGLTVRNAQGVTYSDASSADWDAVAAVADSSSTGYKVLLEGANRLQGQYFVWTTDATGLIKGGSGWKTVDQAVGLGWETLFNLDLNQDTIIGIPLADEDGNGLVDASITYQIYTPTAGLTVRNAQGVTYRDASSADWDAVAAVADSSSTGYKVLLEGANRLQGQYFVWTTDATGLIKGGSGWKTVDQAVGLGWETLFNLDLNQDTIIGIPLADEDGDGLVDASITYQIYTPTAGLTVRNAQGVTYRDASSAVWNAVAAVADSSSTGYKVLLEGANRLQGQYFVWTTDATGLIKGGSGWKTVDQAVGLGWETLFNLDLNQDTIIGIPLADEDGDGLVDASITYQIYTPTAGLTVRNAQGVTYRDASSAVWNAVAAVVDSSSTGYKVLLEGANRLQGQYFVWTTDATGLIKGASGWKTVDQAVVLGWETLFNLDLNQDTIIGLPPNLEIAAVDADKLEGNTGTTAFTFQVTRSGNTTIASSVAWAVRGTGTNPANALDFANDVFPSGSLTFAAGETSKTITVQVVADALFGPDETFAVALSNPTSAAIATGSATGVIRNDDLSIQEPVFVKETTLPDGALGAITGKGWTATGLVHDPLENVFWVANHGQATKSSPFTPSIVKMDLDANAILAQIDVKTMYPDNTSIQGLTLDASNRSLWFAAPVENAIRNVSFDGMSLGTISFRANGLTYDPLTDRLIVLHRTGTEPEGSQDYTISELDKSTGTIVRSYTTGFAYGADQLYLDPATRHLYMSYGGDWDSGAFAGEGNVRVFDHDSGQIIGAIGSLDKVTATEGIAVIGSDLYMISDDYFDPNPRDSGITNRLVSFRHVQVGSSEGRDVITGTQAADTFRWGALTETNLASYDTIVNYGTGDQIEIEGLSYGATLTSSLGDIDSLTYANMRSFLNEARLPAHAAAAFTVTGMDGTFVALNDQRSSFQSDSDGLLFLKRYAISSSNTVTIA
jgi:hypothetical protein